MNNILFLDYYLFSVIFVYYVANKIEGPPDLPEEIFAIIFLSWAILPLGVLYWILRKVGVNWLK